MKILHIYKDYYPIVGGIENHIKLLAEGQAAAGHAVTVLVTNTTWQTTTQVIDGVRVIKSGRLFKAASTPVSLRLMTQVRAIKTDICHLHFPYPVGEVGNYLFGSSAHTVLTYHSDIVRQARLLRLYHPLMHKILARVDRIIVASQPYLESSTTLQRYRTKCVVVPYGIPQDRFRSVDPGKVAALKNRYGSQPILLFVGVLRYYKGLQYLLQAMVELNAKLLVVGDGPQGAYLRQRAYNLGIADKVEFVGQVTDTELPVYYQAADLFILPSSERSEAFGLVLVEALASGIPIVSTELHTGTSYVNKDQESGLVIPPKDPQSLSQAIKLILGNAELQSKLAHGALARASLFEVDRMNAQIMEIYNQVLQS